jgi:adenine-specific DNA-methyltransferase
MTTPLFSELSIQITKSLTKKEKQQNGIFFTPSTITHLLIKVLCSNLDLSKKYSVIEPSCGSGEFVHPLFSYLQIEWIKGIEFHPIIFQKISKNQFPNLEWIHQDFLKTNIKADIFIGNPPYFVLSKSQVPSSYSKYVEGRPNIFVLFILHALHLLNDNGFIAFVIPSSFLNSKYYEKTRRYILEQFTIQEIIPFEEQNDFIETEQATIGLIVQKKKDLLDRNKNFVIRISDQVMFFDSKSKLKLDQLYSGAISMKDFGLKVKTGPFVWNQHKKELTLEPTEKSSLLVYNTNIVQNKFERKQFKNKEKKQYISDGENVKGPMIVVNRGNGNSKYQFTYCYLDEKIEERGYTVENHLNMILGDKEKLLKVLESFSNPKTKEFLTIYCGNNGLSKSEIETVLPVYIDSKNE